MLRQILHFLALALPALLVSTASAQMYTSYGDPWGAPQGSPAPYADAGSGVQLYPFDQQDPWIHGYFQRYPAYGGYTSFRPYNYKQVFSQAQVSGQWGSPAGMPYSQQFWNRYRSNYMEGMLHDTAPNPATQGQTAPNDPFAPGVNPIAYPKIWNRPAFDGRNIPRY